MTFEDKIREELGQWSHLCQAIQDSQQGRVSTDFTFHMQQTETLLAASASLRLISQKVRNHARDCVKLSQEKNRKLKDVA